MATITPINTADLEFDNGSWDADGFTAQTLASWQSLAAVIDHTLLKPDAPHAHNAYIDYALSLGLVGLVTYSLLYLIVARRAFQFFMSGAEYYLRWPLTYLVFVLVYQCTESGIFGGNNLLWIVFSSLAFSLTLERQEFTVQDAQEAPGLTISSAAYSNGR